MAIENTITVKVRLQLDGVIEAIYDTQGKPIRDSNLRLFSLGADQVALDHGEGARLIYEKKRDIILPTHNPAQAFYCMRELTYEFAKSEPVIPANIPR